MFQSKPSLLLLLAVVYVSFSVFLWLKHFPVSPPPTPPVPAPIASPPPPNPVVAVAPIAPVPVVTDFTVDLALVNSFRIAHKVSPLVGNAILTKTASDFAAYLVSKPKVDTRSAHDQTIYKNAVSAGYKPVSLGEVVALKYDNFKEAFTALSTSPADIPILSDSKYRDIGIGKISDPKSVNKSAVVIVLGRTKP